MQIQQTMRSRWLAWACMMALAMITIRCSGEEPFCGDGYLDRDLGEVCDDGNAASGDGCSADCRSIEICGNGIVDLGEECDDGNNIDGDGCSAACASDETCGNSIVDAAAGEACDDGGESATCNADCTVAACGDGVLNASAGEQCDDGNNMDGDGCSADCTSDETCGNGIVDEGETCDDGGDSATCDADCTLAECGDGWANELAGEECDTGSRNTATCNYDCTAPVCGDSIHNSAANEQCDDGGDSATCDADCTFALCPDDYYNPEAGEECDDGNGNDSDACSNTCKLN